VKVLLLLILLLFSTLNANKVLYLHYTEIPDRVIKGEIFSITLKSISTIQDFQDIKYRFSKQSGLKPLSTIPDREIKGKFYLEKFYFLTTRSYARLPDITASLVGDSEHNSTTITGSKLNVVTLNPKNDFSYIVANSFELTNYKTTSYDTKHNIIIFTAIAKNADLSRIKFKDIFKQGIESIDNEFQEPKITYFLVINKKLERFSFSYFNLKKNKFIKITIPIIVDDDSVTTQSDLKPKDQSKEKLKRDIASVVAILILIIAIWRKKYIYLILVLIPVAYIAYIVIPSKEVCIKKDSNIYLLPVQNGTIFETTTNQYNLPKEGAIDNYTKVKLKNEKIGWVKNEDICSN
jgi:hypothetical protein